jgi:hypothetical protein
MHFFAFQYDINSNFAKKFGFATIEKFWDKFTEDKNPCYYEQLIPERPCRPFYDFEFDKNENNDKDTDIIYQSFMKLLFQWFKQSKNIVLKDEMLLEEDASSFEKCSRHKNYILPILLCQC